MMLLGSKEKRWFIRSGYSDYDDRWTFTIGIGVRPDSPDWINPWKLYWKLTPAAWVPRLVWKDVFLNGSIIHIPYGLRAFGRCWIFLKGR